MEGGTRSSRRNGADISQAMEGVGGKSPTLPARLPGPGVQEHRVSTSEEKKRQIDSGELHHCATQA